MIADGNTIEALDAVLQVLSEKHKAYDKFIQLRGQWKTLEEKIHLGLTDGKSVATDQNRITNATLEFIKGLPDSAFTPLPSQTDVPKTRDLVRQMAEHNNNDYTYDLFFCFSNYDLEEARLICDFLRGYGLRVFFSADELRHKGGHQFSKVIDDALETSRHFLLYCTPNAMESDWVQKEYRAFHDNVHISDQKNRSFLIFEGNGFDLTRLPITYRNNQRIRSIDEIISSILPAHPAQVVKPLYENKEKFVRQKSTSQKDWEDDSIEEEGIIARIAREYGENEYRIIEAKPFPTRLVVSIGAGLLTLCFLWFWANRVPKKASTIPREKIADNRKSGFTMVSVSGGTFIMGCKHGRDIECEKDEKPAHKVTLSLFNIGMYEVTQADWLEIMGSNPSFNKGCDDCPVENVSWNDIQDFLLVANANIPGKNYRLPTEAEWEFSARGGNQSKGYRYSGGDILKNVAWFDSNSDSKTHPVGRKKSNELGIFDMSGNVWEWCGDWYCQYSSRSQLNPTGPPWGWFRVPRGGSWDAAPRYTRTAHRGYYVPGSDGHNLGFRLTSSPQ